MRMRLAMTATTANADEDCHGVPRALVAKVASMVRAAVKNGPCYG